MPAGWLSHHTTARPVLQRPSQAEFTPPQPPPGLRTPSTSDKLSLLVQERPATASRLPALCGTSAQWQLPFPPVPNSAPPQLPVSRQLALPADPPSPLGAGGHNSGGLGGGSSHGGSGGEAASEGGYGLGASAAADPLWAVAPAELAVQLAPSLPLYSSSQVAAEREAERQLSLLQQLKCSIAAATQPSASSCGSPFGRAGSSGGSLPVDIHQAASHPHLPGQLEGLSSWQPCIPRHGFCMLCSGPCLALSTRLTLLALHQPGGLAMHSGTCASPLTPATPPLHRPLSSPGAGL